MPLDCSRGITDEGCGNVRGGDSSAQRRIITTVTRVVRPSLVVELSVPAVTLWLLPTFVHVSAKCCCILAGAMKSEGRGVVGTPRRLPKLQEWCGLVRMVQLTVLPISHFSNPSRFTCRP